MLIKQIVAKLTENNCRNIMSSITSYALVSNVYTKVNTDVLLNNKLNTSSVSISTYIKNKSGVDVVVVYNIPTM